MRTLLQGLLVLAVIVMANVVAAGVLMVLGRALAEPIADDQAKMLMLALCGVAAVASSMLFIRGALTLLVERLQCQPKPARGTGRPHGCE